MTQSQNGWPASANRAEIDVQPFQVGSVAFPGGVRAGSVAAILAYVVTQFHARVEPLVEGWCWGFNFRVVSGSSTVSNHGSGTAVDVNAPRHPLGAPNTTFSAAQKREIRKILKEVDSVVRWGGDYAGRKDEMHFEINTDMAGADRVAARLTNQEDAEMSALSDAVEDLGHRVNAMVEMKEKTEGGPSKGQSVEIVKAVNDLAYRVEALSNDRKATTGGPHKGEANAVHARLDKLEATLAEILAAVKP